MVTFVVVQCEKGRREKDRKRKVKNKKEPEHGETNVELVVAQEHISESLFS